MDIKTTSKEIRFSTPINEGCKRKFELMKEDYIKLKFSLLAPVYFKLGDYIEHEQFGRFEISSIQKPKFNTSNGGYDYELQFDKYYMKWKNKILMYKGEAAWNLTADLATHLSVFTSELTKIGYKYYGTAFSFSVDDSVSTEAKLISYDSTNFIEALNKYADAWGCEWWVEDSIVFFGKCEFGTAQDFEIGVNVESMTASESSGNFFTRVYGFGSERNIPTNYRPTEEGVVVQGVVQRRLMMPVDTPYIDAYPDMTTEEAIVGVVVMDNIYPRRETIVANVKTEEYRDEIEQEDGSTTIVQWDAYRFQDIGLDFKESYLLKELKVKFESGSLNGMEFNVNFVKEGDEQWFEVVRNETYGRPLPDTILYPKNGDKCILSGFDIALVGEQYVPAAEQELKEEIQKYVDKIKEDDKNYSCKMMAESVDDLYSLGSRVKLVNAAYFENGSRESRIIGYEYDLAIPYDHPVYIVGQTASYSRLQALSDKLDSLTFQGQTFTGGSGSGVYLIRKGDITPASDFNAFSALRALETFLRKDKNEVMPFLLSLTKGAEFGEYFDSLLNGKGTGIHTNGRIQTDHIEVRKTMTVMSLIINEIQGMASDFVFSDVGTVQSVTQLDEGVYRLIIDKQHDLDTLKFDTNYVCKQVVNSLVIGGTDYYTSWFRVVSKNINDNAITVVLYPDSEVPGGRNFPPVADYNIQRHGHSNIITDGEYNPMAAHWTLSSREGRIQFLQNVFKPILEDYNYALTLGKLPNLKILESLPVTTDDVGLVAQTIIAEKIYRTDWNGHLVTDKIDRGTWSEEVAASDAPYRCINSAQEGNQGSYTLLEQHTVYHLGIKWACLIDETLDAPATFSPAWQAIEGDTNYTAGIASSNGSKFRLSHVSTDLTALVYFGANDITDEVMSLAGVEVQWRRDTGDVGSDNTWKPTYIDGQPHRIHISTADMGRNWITNRVASFIVDIFFPVGGQYIPVSQSFNFKI